MARIMKAVQAFENCIDRKAERMSHSHPYILFFSMFIALPLGIMAAIFFFTIIITVPIASVFVRQRLMISHGSR